MADYWEVGAMASELRKTGIGIVGDMPWGTHFCHFYETKQDLLDTLVPYFKAGLESKEFCLWVVSDSEMITAEEAKGALAEAVPDFDRHLADGNIEVLDALDWYLEKNVFNLEKVTSAWDAKLKRALALGYEGMRVSGDTFWLREKDWKDFCAYEKQLNDSITDQHINLICIYSLAKSGAAETLDVAQTHRFAIARRQGKWEVIESLELVQAKAEIKRLNEALQRVIERTSKPPVILRYGVAVLSVTTALIITLWVRMELGQPYTPIVALFLCAVMSSAWFGGVGPGLLAIALSLLAFDFYFATPFYSWAVDIKEIPRLLIFTLSALFVGLLSAEQRSKAESLRRARDVLDETVQEVKRTNVALRAEIVARKRAETLLHAKEQEFRAIVENAPDQIIRYDRDFRRTYVNPAVARFYGLPAESLIGKPLGWGIREALADVTEDELEQVRQRVADVFNTGKSYDYEMSWMMPTGRRYFSIRLFPELDLNGSVVNALGISRDITEGKQAEEALRQSEDRVRLIIDTIPVMAWSLRPDGVVDFLNQRWIDYAGLSLEQYVEEPTRPVHPEDIPRVMGKWLANIVAGEPNEDEIRLRRADGEYRWFLVRNAPLRDEQGNVVKWYGASIDIEDRKRAEEKLRQSESQLAEAQHLARVGSWNWDLQNNVLNWSDELYRIFGVDPQAFNPAFEDVVTEFIHAEDRALVRGVIESSLKTQEPFSFYYRILTLDGEERVIYSRGDTASDEQGNPIRMFGTAQDVTERKRAEEALKESQHRLEEAQRIAHVGHWERELKTGLITWSDEIYRILGLPLPENDEPPTEWRHMIHPEDRERVFLVIEGAQRGLRRYDVEYRIVRPDGEVRFLHSQGDIIRDEQGQPLRAFGIAQDITERKRAGEALRQAEEKYHSIFEHAIEGIFQTTPDGQYITANPALARMLGYDSPEELASNRTDIERQQYVEPERRAEFKRLLEEHGVVRSFEYEAYRKDGHKIWLSDNVHAVRDESGAILYYEGSTEDITERKQAEERLRATTEQLRALSARIHSAKEEEGTRIAREIHDELGAALTSLRWDLDGFDKIISESGNVQQLQVLQEKIEAMMRLIDTTISTVRRIASELRPSVLDELGLVEAIEWQAQQFQARTGIICRCDCSLENLGINQQQSTAVFRIFQEALTNILRHAQATRVDVTMKMEAGEFVLTTSDNGRGITEDEKSSHLLFGLLGMRERALLTGGKLEITGGAGGTVVVVRVPI